MTNEITMTNSTNNKGQSIVEFTLILPLVLLFVALVVETAMVGIRSIILQNAAFRAARVAHVYQPALADDELRSMLPSLMFEGGWIETSAEDMMQDAANDHVRVVTFGRPVIGVDMIGPAQILWRETPKSFAMTAGLSNRVLQGGDTPSPYCNMEGNYEACGYPQ